MQAKERYALSEAIRSGSRMILGYENPGVDVLALVGHDALPHDDRDRFARNPGMLNSHAYSGLEIIKRHPWLNDTILCPWCADKIQGSEIITHPTDEHEIDIEDECQWLAEIEEEPETRARGVAVYLQNEREHQLVLSAARQLNLTVSAFIAGALRLVLDYGLSVSENSGALQ